MKISIANLITVMVIT